MLFALHTGVLKSDATLRRILSFLLQLGEHTAPIRTHFAVVGLFSLSISMTSIWTGIWISLVAWRIVWTCWPQPGYIHPDEFFQSTEVVVGDILKLEVERTWEFNNLQPIRSMLIPHVIYGLPVRLLGLLECWLSITITPYMVLVAPRLAITLLMFSVDIIIWKLCKCLGVNPMLGINLYGSSYVTMTYLTRPLSNTIECLLFAIILLVVVPRFPQTTRIFSGSSEAKKRKKGGQKNESTSASIAAVINLNVPETITPTSKRYKKKSKNKIVAIVNKTPNKSVIVSQTANKTASIIEDRKVNEKRLEVCRMRKQQPKAISVLPYVDLLVLATCLSAGTFNRPTFPLYSVTPLLMWLYNTSHNKVIVAAKNATFLVLYSFQICAVFVVADTFYYKTTVMEFSNKLYSCISTKGQQNIPLCVWYTLTSSVTFTPLNFIYYNIQGVNLAKHGLHPFYFHALVNMPLLYGMLCILFIYNMYQYFTSNTHFNSICILSVFVIIPVDILSIFPHQEPRFLVPLLPAMVLIGAAVMEKYQFKKKIAIIWIISNVILAMFYGILHQGGLVPSLLEMRHSKNLADKPKTELLPGEYHVIFYHTYMPPTHLFLNRGQDSPIVSHDLKGSKISKLNHLLSELHSANSTRSVYVVLPSTVADVFKQTQHMYSLYDEEKTFGPHLSIEDPPLFLMTDISCEAISRVLGHLHLKVVKMRKKISKNLIHH